MDAGWLSAKVWIRQETQPKGGAPGEREVAADDGFSVPNTQRVFHRGGNDEKAVNPVGHSCSDCAFGVLRVRFRRHGPRGRHRRHRRHRRHGANGATGAPAPRAPPAPRARPARRRPSRREAWHGRFGGRRAGGSQQVPGECHRHRCDRRCRRGGDGHLHRQERHHAGHRDHRRLRRHLQAGARGERPELQPVGPLHLPPRQNRKSRVS